jgi:hypothetical protein
MMMVRTFLFVLFILTIVFCVYATANAGCPCCDKAGCTVEKVVVKSKTVHVEAVVAPPALCRCHAAIHHERHRLHKAERGVRHHCWRHRSIARRGCC